MAIEEPDDIAEDLADKLGIYSEERQHWTYEFKQRVRKAVEVEQRLAQPDEELGTCDLVSRPHRRDHCGKAWSPLAETPKEPRPVKADIT